MAGKSKSYYVTVFEILDGKHKTVLSKQFFAAGPANEFKKEMLIKYPPPNYSIIREHY